MRGIETEEMWREPTSPKSTLAVATPYRVATTGTGID